MSLLLYVRPLFNSHFDSIISHLQFICADSNLLLNMNCTRCDDNNIIDKLGMLIVSEESKNMFTSSLQKITEIKINESAISAEMKPYSRFCSRVKPNSVNFDLAKYVLMHYSCLVWMWWNFPRGKYASKISVFRRHGNVQCVVKIRTVADVDRILRTENFPMEQKGDAEHFCQRAQHE